MANMNKKTISDINVKGKRVLVRVDFNVPLDKENKITDDKRIVGALPTIKYLTEHGAKTILVSHLGRPKSGPEAKFSMKPAVDRLAELLGREVVLAADVIGDDAKAKVAAMNDGDIVMLENVRFHKEETKNDPAFAKELAALAELYVNDAFGTAHRAHASTAGVANYLPGVSGFLIQKEIDVMGKALQNPDRPFVAILGGAKVSDKIGVINNLIEKVDTLIIGGGMAYTFNAAKGQTVGNSLLEADKIDLAKELLAKAEAKGVKLLLPPDNVITEKFDAEAPSQVVSGDIPDGWMGMDIGPKAIEEFSAAVKDAKTVIWNGPMGVFEFDRFAVGTRQVAQAIADSSAISIIGGGDSAAAIEKLGFADKVTHISTGGGASLEFLEGKVLPGIDCLLDQDARRTIAAGNWKMNKGTPAEASKFIGELLPKIADAQAEVIAAVPSTVLQTALDATAFTNLKVAAQNCFYEDKGAYTGEISAKMLAYMQVPYVVIGHSERRQYFAETDETVNKKVLAALNWGVRPIVCVGESLEQREAGETFNFVKAQVKAALKDVPAERLTSHVTIAYEPIWAIGTGKTASDEQAEEVCAFIRAEIAMLYSQTIAEETRILYGGSVNAENAAGLFAQTNIDGGLVGGASLKADDFASIAAVYQ